MKRLLWRIESSIVGSWTPDDGQSLGPKKERCLQNKTTGSNVSLIAAILTTSLSFSADVDHMLRAVIGCEQTVVDFGPGDENNAEEIGLMGAHGSVGRQTLRLDITITTSDKVAERIRCCGVDCPQER
jgi:hypothetical protein